VRLRFAVEDTGPGIPADQQARLPVVAVSATVLESPADALELGFDAMLDFDVKKMRGRFGNGRS
jgi:hypothetical protein